MTYTVEIARSAVKELKRIPEKDFLRIRREIDNLSADPRPNGVQKIQGIKDSYRIVCGDFRIIYTISEQRLLVVVIRVGNRRDVYRKR